MSKNPKIIFYPVGNGNMILVKLEDNTTILIDMYIRKKCDIDKKECFDVLTHLKDNLEKDGKGRYFVDAFILTHLDKDHIGGIEDNFYLGSLDDCKDKDKIIIKEAWSSERFWKRETEKITLSTDAKAYNKEMRRRVKLHKNCGEKIQNQGDKAIIIGNKDGEHNKIIYKIGDTISKVNSKNLNNFKINILGPLERQKNEDKETFDAKNRGSVILQLEIKVGNYINKILLTGDAEVDVCEYMNTEYERDKLEYDILCSPHHCSMASLGRKADVKKKGNYIISEDAKKSLSYAKEGAIIISSSKEILDDDNNPPHYEAKQEYIKIINNKKDDFLCTAEHPKKGSVEPIVIEFTSGGTQLKTGSSKSKIGLATESSSKNIYPHG